MQLHTVLDVQEVFVANQTDCDRSAESRQLILHRGNGREMDKGGRNKRNAYPLHP
jgi:hypothetical protein